MPRWFLKRHVIEQARWSFTESGSIIVSSDTEAEQIDAVFSSLSVGSVSAASIDVADSSLTLRLGDDLVLRVLLDDEPELRDEHQWLLYVPDGSTWVATADGVLLEPA